MALSELELRRIIEHGFLPLQYKCVIDSRGKLSVELLDSLHHQWRSYQESNGRTPHRHRALMPS